MKQLNAGSNIITVRENNLALIIRIIHKEKVCSRVDLANATGLKQATITNIVNELMARELIVEVGHIQGKGRRKTIGISLNNERFRIIGVRLNRKYCQIGLFDLGGKLLEKREINFEDHPLPVNIMDKISDTVESFLKIAEEKVTVGIGVAIPGPYVSKSGKIILMSGVPGWDKVDIQKELQKRFSLPVFLEHDANCGALAELWYGNIENVDDMVFVAADVGVGAGVLVNGKLYRGSMGIAGEIGHTSIDYGGPKCECGNRGCLELYCSTIVLLEEYKKEAAVYGRPVDENISLEDILREVVMGDPFARGVFRKIATFLGFGLVNVVNTFNPRVIILSDRLALAGEYLVEIVRKTLKERLLKPVYEGLEVKIGSFVEDSMLFGASALVLEQLVRHPSLYFVSPQKERYSIGTDHTNFS